MKSINDVIQEALKEINFEEIAKEAAVSKIKESVKNAINEQFSYRSDLSKALDEHIKKEISLDFSSIKLPEYRAFFIGEVNKALVSFIGNEHATEIVKHINEKIVGESRDEIEFSDFWDELCGDIENECDESDNEKYFVEFGESDRTPYLSSKYYSLTISEKKDNYSSSSKDQSEVMYFAFSDGVIYHSRSNNDFELSSIFTWLKALQFRKTKILNIKNESLTIPDRY